MTRNEFKKVTQAEYDALEQAGELIPNCYYIITDDETYDELMTRLNGIDTNITGIQSDITNINSDITDIETAITGIETAITGLQNKKLYQHNISFSVMGADRTGTMALIYICLQIFNTSATKITSGISSFLSSNGFTSNGKFYTATGDISEEMGNTFPIVKGIFYEDSKIKGIYLENDTEYIYTISSEPSCEDVVVRIF